MKDKSTNRTDFDELQVKERLHDNGQWFNPGWTPCSVRSWFDFPESYFLSRTWRVNSFTCPSTYEKKPTSHQAYRNQIFPVWTARYPSVPTSFRLTVSCTLEVVITGCAPQDISTHWPVQQHKTQIIRYVFFLSSNTWTCSSKGVLSDLFLFDPHLPS